ncbi:MAG: TraR/DksA C4-type zinc finger protein [Candidatus Binataceae bacterium]|jgi:DnaK suppressor protein
MKDAQERFEGLRQLLIRQRGDTTARVRTIRQEQNNEALSTPGDEMDIARSLADVETHTSLIENAEHKLRQIDNALMQLEQGNYGICANCSEEIPLARLEAVPFAIYCVDCQAQLSKGAAGMRDLGRPAYKQWTPPPEADEQAMAGEGNGADELDVQHAALQGDEDADDLVPEDEGESEPPPAVEAKTRRRRSRTAKNGA